MSTTWRERIAEARARGSFTEQDRADAGDFLTCAVAEQALAGRLFNYIPSGAFFGSPAFDRHLWDIGGQFPGTVLSNAFTEAEELLDAIEERMLQLKREAST